MLIGWQAVGERTARHLYAPGRVVVAEDEPLAPAEVDGHEDDTHRLLPMDTFAAAVLGDGQNMRLRTSWN